ncbi:GntR family transcriptional regulator [Nocardiopsis sp. CNT312]|nr:GntR family transcriptional regulator [Nocardiopsis sp. CNT312]
MVRPIYQRVADTLRQRIIAGDDAPGGRLPSRQDPAPART